MNNIEPIVVDDWLLMVVVDVVVVVVVVAEVVAHHTDVMVDHDDRHNVMVVDGYHDEDDESEEVEHADDVHTDHERNAVEVDHHVCDEGVVVNDEFDVDDVREEWEVHAVVVVVVLHHDDVLLVGIRNGVAEEVLHEDDGMFHRRLVDRNVVDIFHHIDLHSAPV